MNTQLERPSRGHTNYEEDPHNILHDQHVGLHLGHEQEEHHGEKKSVLKKVKAKAKKIKESIKEHVGHGHEVHEDEDDDDEMDTDPENHGTIGHESVARRHEPKLGEGTGGEGAPLKKIPGAFQTFDTTARYTPGQDQTLGWSRTDTETPKVPEEQPFAPRNTPVGDVLSSGASTGHIEVGKKGPPVKYGGIIERPTGVEIDPRDPRNVGKDLHSGTYQVKTTDHSSIGLHRSNLSERAPMEGATHVPASKPQAHYTSLEPKPQGYTSKQEEILGWTRTDTGKLRESEKQFNVLKNQDLRAEDEGGSLKLRAEDEGGSLKPHVIHGSQEVLEKDPHGPRIGGDKFHQTGIGMLGEFKDPSSVLKNTQTATHPGRTHATRAEEGSEKLGAVLGRPGVLEKDPHGPGGPGVKLRPGNYESKVTDPTGKGGEEMGVAPVLHQLDKMNIQDKSLKTPGIGQEGSLFKSDNSSQNEKFSTGSHNQFSPEPVSSKTSPFLGTSDSGFQFNSNASQTEGQYDSTEQNLGSYTDKISSAATMVANKAKQATSSMTSRLGYGGTSDSHSEPGGYGSVTTSIADKAVQAKDAIAAKLGYGGADEGQSMQEDEPKGGSIIGTVKNTPVYNKVAEVGSTLLSKVHGDSAADGSSKPEAGSTMGSTVQGSAADHESGADKGVSVKEYLVEKLKPGEEDKALSEVITEALPLHKRKEDVSKPGQEVETKKVVITGRVTESDEVARRLGRSAEKSYDDAGVGFARPGKGVMDRIYEATSSLFQKGGEDPENTAKGNQRSLRTDKENELKRGEEPRRQ